MSILYTPALIWAVFFGAITAGVVENSFEYSVDQVGLFLQEDPTVNANPPDYVESALGLIDRIYETDKHFDPDGEKTQWERFAHYLKSLNSGSEPGISYKVLYLSRHGEAYHNVAQSFYGSECWDCYWSGQAGNGNITWKDAELTSAGVDQASVANVFWQETAKKAKIPLPQSFYTSPMVRCLSTANITFGSLPTFAETPFAATVKEHLREPLNGCTCAWHHDKKWIHELFPSYKFDPEVAEKDELWDAEFAESLGEQKSRLSMLLDDVFSTDDSTFISFTSHGGTIRSLLSVMGYPNPDFNLKTGQVIPVLVRAERMGSPGVYEDVDPPTRIERCNPCAPGP